MSATTASTSTHQNDVPRLYLDFEGNKAGHLFLGCYRFAGETVQVVLDCALAPAAEAKGLKCMSPEMFVEHVLQVAHANQALISAWSTAELQAITRMRDFEPTGYENMLKRAKSWVNRNELKGIYLPGSKRRRAPSNPFANDDWSLSRFTAWLLKEKPPRGYAKGKTTSRLGHVIVGLKRAGNYEGLTPTQKRKWGDVLRHNRWDVEVLERLRHPLSQDPQKLGAIVRT